MERRDVGAPGGAGVVVGFRAENESSIVSKVFEDIDDHETLLHHRFFKNVSLNYTREFTLRSGRRIDMIGLSKKNRYAWIIEFKLHADIDAIIQILNYEREVRWLQQATAGRFRLIQKTIIAETFCERAIFFAERHGIQILQFNQVTKNYFTLDPLVERIRERGRPCWMNSMVLTEL